MQYNKRKKTCKPQTELLISCVQSQIELLQQDPGDTTIRIFNLMNLNQLHVLLWELEVEYQQNTDGKTSAFTPSFQKIYLHQN